MVHAVSTRSFLLLHGLNHHRPAGHWQYWLADRLRAHGERVLYPGLPFEDAPRVEEWLETLHWLLRQTAGEGERVVVSNSLAGLLWFRFAAAWPDDLQPVDRLLLVAPPDSPRVPDAAASFRLEGDPDGPAVRASVRAPIRLVCSDGDHFNPRGADQQYAHLLGAEVDLVRGAGHLGPVEGYGPWPSALAWCSDPAVRIGPNLPD